MASRSRKVYAVIPAGGSGSRLWPRSRRSHPKHLLALSGSGQPLLLETVNRLRPLADEVFVVTEDRQVQLIRDLVPDLDLDHIITEAQPRGTTNAMGLAALTLSQHDPDAVMIWAAADHVIQGTAAYRAAIRSAVGVARAAERMVAIGLTPTYPATGFGYIEAGDELHFGRQRAVAVRRFVEKPPLARAKAYVDGGKHLWNLSMFSFRLPVFLAELERYGPAHWAGLNAVVTATRAGHPVKAAKLYRELPVEAIDYTVMERTERLVMVEAGFHWVDVGSWADFADLLTADADGNVIEGRPILIDTSGSLISVPDKMVAVIGMRDLVIVDTPDALLVCPKSRAQDVKKVVEALGRLGKSQYL